MEVLGAGLFYTVLWLICFFSWRICFRENFRNKVLKIFLLEEKAFEKSFLNRNLYFNYEDYVAQREGSLLAFAIFVGLISFSVLILVSIAQLLLLLP